MDVVQLLVGLAVLGGVGWLLYASRIGRPKPWSVHQRKPKLWTDDITTRTIAREKRRKREDD